MGANVGKLSVSSENIFPIIRDKLYDNQDAFVRELVSNCADAITKRKLLADPAGSEPYRIEVRLNQAAGAIVFADNGVGMTRSEVDRYINSIALSGAADFVRTQEQGGEQPSTDIIGRFGLGFYAAFMAADLVEIRTLSFAPGAQAARWICSGTTMEFSLEDCDKSGVGTEVVLHVPPESPYLSETVMRKALTKYCVFCPYDLYLTIVPRDEGNAQPVGRDPQPLKLNDAEPIWVRKPETLTDEDYISFYHSYFEDFYEPAFWINLYDEVLGIRGIVYCRHIDDSASSLNGEVRLYSRQVFVCNNLKGVIPDFLMLQNGLVDIRQLPLNVSRASLREDGYAAAIHSHLSKRVGQALCKLFQQDRGRYEQIWPEINPFIKLGMLQSKTFRHEIKDCVLYRHIDGRYMTLDEFLAHARPASGGSVYYVSDEIQQAQYVSLFQKSGIPAVLLTHVVDNPLIRLVELSHKELNFKRIDADLSVLLEPAALDQPDLNQAQQALMQCYMDVLPQARVLLQAACMKSPEIPALMVLDERSRRIQEEADLYHLSGTPDAFPLEEPQRTLILNVRSPLVQHIIRRPEQPFSKLIATQLFDLAQLSQEALQAREMTDFIDRSSFIMEKLLQCIDTARKGEVDSHE